MFSTTLEKSPIRPDLQLDFQRISALDLGSNLNYSANDSRDAAAGLSVKEGHLTGSHDNDPSLLLAAIANCSEFFARLIGFAKKALISTHQEGSPNPAVEHAKQQLSNAQFIMNKESILNDIYDLFVKQPPNPKVSLRAYLGLKSMQFADTDGVSIELRGLVSKVSDIFKKLGLPSNESIKLFASQNFKLIKTNSDDTVSFYKITDPRFDDLQYQLTGDQVKILNTIFEMSGLEPLQIVN